uniref:Uncharacterized protein n=1 Tax=Rhizophora mucronata TaxID=61149 RepID=A0A2P2JNK2_RHIMU
MLVMGSLIIKSKVKLHSKLLLVFPRNSWVIWLLKIHLEFLLSLRKRGTYHFPYL